MGFGMNKSLKNIIYLSLLISANAGFTIRAADNKDNKKAIENVVTKKPNWSLFRPSTWWDKSTVVKPDEVKPAPEKPKVFVQLAKNLGKRTFLSGVAAAGCYWFAKSNALESLLRMGGHYNLASHVEKAKIGLGCFAGAFVYHQTSEFKREFVDRGTEFFADKVLNCLISKVVDNEKFGPFAEKCIGGGVDNALEKENVLKRLNEIVNKGIEKNLGNLNVSFIHNGGASSKQVTQFEEKIEGQLERQKTEQDIVNQKLFEQQQTIIKSLESLKPKPSYSTLVWNFIASKFKQNGNNKKPANQSVTQDSSTPTPTNTNMPNMPENKSDQPNKNNKE